MQLQRHTLTPQMVRYDDFDDRAATRYLPYLMYFHRTDYASDVVNTDRFGFRVTEAGGARRCSPGGDIPDGPVRVFAGSSTAFGIGASCDAATIPSRLWAKHAPSLPWLNFGGRSYNSAQELMLFMFYRHLLPEIDRVVLLSGFNTLALSRLPEWQQGDSGAFFYCGEYYEQLDQLRAKNSKPKRGSGRRAERADDQPARSEQVEHDPDKLIATAVGLTERYLAGWRDLAAVTGARVTFVLQPLATWVRAEPATEERVLFTELDKLSRLGVFEELFGDIAGAEVGRRYATALSAACDRTGVDFLDLNSLLAEATTSADWLYVDRAHLTDSGHDIVAGLLAEHLRLS
jgi:hypothetical protein